MSPTLLFILPSFHTHEAFWYNEVLLFWPCMRPSRAIAPGSRLLCSTGMIIDPISGRFVDQRMAHLDPEELLECPFDPLHQIRAKRFQYHLVKCSKVRIYLRTCSILLGRSTFLQQHGRPFYQCPNNARHVKTSKEDFDAHKLVCEDRVRHRDRDRFYYCHCLVWFLYDRWRQKQVEAEIRHGESLFQVHLQIACHNVKRLVYWSQLIPRNLELP